MKKASKDLEAFVDEVQALWIRRGMKPKVFIAMQRRYGTVEAIRKFLTSPILLEMQKLRIVDHSLDAAVLKFPNEFDAETITSVRRRSERVNEKV